MATRAKALAWSVCLLALCNGCFSRNEINLVSLSGSSITPQSNTIAPNSTVSVTVTIVSDDLLPVRGLAIRLTSNDPQARITQPVDRTDERGVAKATYSSGHLGTWTLRADVATPSGTQQPVPVAGYITVQESAIGLALQAPSSVQAGVAFRVNVSALGAGGTLQEGYSGTVRLSASDPGLTGGTTVTFTAADAGSKSSQVSLQKSGTTSLTAQDINLVGVSGQTLIAVTCAAPSQMEVQISPNGLLAGDAATVSLLLLDRFGNPVPNTAGTATFVSSDANAALPTTLPYVTDSTGHATLAGSVVFQTAGAQSLTVTDSSSGATGQGAANVAAAAAASLVLNTQPMPAVRGQNVSLDVVAYDVYGNIATGYQGTLAVQCSEVGAFPAHVQLLAANLGMLSTPGVFQTLGTQSVLVQDTVVSGLQATTTLFVNAPAPYFTLIPSSPAITAGSPQSIAITAYNVDTTVNTQYGGSVAFTSTDTGASLPAPVTFSPGSNGAVSVPGFTLVTAGQRTVTATDTGNPAINGVSSTITVTSSQVLHLTLTGIPGSVTAGQSLGAVVTALDMYNNVVTSYAGTVKIYTDDANAVVSANYTFGPADQGAASLPLSLRTLGTHSVDAIDINNGSLQASVSGVQVRAGATTQFSVAGAASPLTAGTASSFTVTALDAYANPTPNYLGAVRVTSSDPQASLPANYTFLVGDAGVKSFPITLKTAGTQSITTTDTVASSIFGTQSNISVQPAAATHLAVAANSNTVLAGQVGTLRLVALDAFSNVAAHYTGTVGFQSTDAQATVPGHYAFTAADNGAHTFSNAVVFQTAGVQSINGNDVASPSIAGATGPVVVTAAGAASMNVSGLPANAVAATPYPVVVSVVDSFGNAVISYLGATTFTSSDAQAVLPANYTFTAADAGTHTFSSIALKVAGSQTVTAADTISAGIFGVDATMVVAANASSVHLSNVPSSVASGQIFNANVLVQDAYANVATSYTGTLRSSSSDGAAVVSGPYTFTATDRGQKTLAFTLKTIGSQSVTVTDTLNAALTATQGSITVNSSNAANLSVSGIGNGTAGTPATVVVSALDASNGVLTGYLGTVHFSSTDAQSTLPANYTFVAGDNGIHTFTGGVVLATAGTQSVTATDVSTSITGSQGGIVITPASATHLTLAGLSAHTSGVTQTLTVLAADAFGNTDTNYVGALHFTTSDAQATVPPNYTFVLADGGKHTFTNAVALATSGSQTVTATSTSAPIITGLTSAVVSAGVATHLTVTSMPGGASPVIGSPVVVARDAYQNVATSYRGTVHWTSSDAQATLPANYAFLAADSGVHTFTSGVILRTNGSQGLTATDTSTASVNGTQSAIAVTPGAASSLKLTGLASAIAGTAQSLVVSVTDSANNTVTGYLGSVTFASNDPSAVVPATYSFVAGDLGVHTFSSAVVLKTTGTRQVTGTDTTTSSITGSAVGLVITPAAASTLTLAGLTSGSAGRAQTLTVTAYDPFGNVASGYRGVAQTSSTDSSATLPGFYTFTSTDSGTHSFAFGVVLTSVGTQSVTTKDTVTSSIAGTQGSLVITAAAATHFAVSGATGGAAPAVSSAVVTALDAYGNIATAYAGTIHSTSSDTQAVLPANYTFLASDNGVHTFSGGITLRTVGSQSITATDTTTSTINGTQSALVVTAGPAKTLTVIGVSGGTSPVTSTPNVAAIDAFGNVATGYLGAVTFTSTDPNAALAGAYTFVVADHGAHSFVNGAVLKTAGTQTVTCRDTTTSSIAGTSSAAVITAAAAKALHVSGLHSGGVPVIASAAVVAVDVNGNRDPTYRGAVLFTSSDASALLPTPPAYTFTAADAGAHTFSNGVTLKTAGTQSVTATDSATSSIFGTQSGLVVTAGTLNALVVSNLTNSAAGTALSPLVTAVDGYNNTVKTYTGTVHFTSSDSGASVPADYAFTAANNGAHVFSAGAIFVTAGTQSLTAADTVSTSVTGSQSVVVSAGAAAHLQLTGIAGSVATNLPLSFGVTALDTYGNTATSYVGTVTFTSTDAAATLPSNHTFITANAGTYASNKQLTFASAGTQTFAATDTSAPSLNGNVSVLVTTTLLPGGMSGQAFSACAVVDNGNVKCWGYNRSGNLGYGDTLNRGTNVAQMGAGLPYVVLPSSRTAVLTGGGGDTVGADGLFSCALLDTHDISCWGINAEGELGLGDTTVRRAPTSAVLLGSRSAVSLAPGGQHMCALLDNKQVACWGFNGGGQLGVGDTITRSTPATAILGARTALAVTAGSYHTCALLDNHKVSCWGANDDGELGYGDNLYRATPGTSTFINLGTGRTALSVSAGGYSTCAILDNHAVACWGKNNVGQLGVANTNEQDLPVVVNLGARTALSVAMGYTHACALLDNSAVTCWGQNSSGQLGLGDVAQRTSPATATVALQAGRTASAISAGSYFSCALLDTQGITCWGQNANGQLGLGDTANRGTAASSVPSTFAPVSLF